MIKVLKIEAFSGASGDMFLSALAKLTDRYNDLIKLPSLLYFDDQAEIKITDVNKNGIACKHVKVVEKVKQHHHRHLSNINELIKNSALTENAKKIALEIFEIIGKAEAEVHNIPIEKIHFHEVGSVDSILDICGAAYLLDILKIEKTILVELITGKGFVNTAHGKLPIPAPATKLILQGIPNNYGNEEGEKLTPTGAAIIKYLNPIYDYENLIDISTAYGPGEKSFEYPNVLRLSLCEIRESQNELLVLETNIDDTNQEYLGIEFQEKLLEMGAIDFYISQILMKKGRPGLLLSVIVNKTELQIVSNFILSFTSTIGLRYYPIKRIELEREFKIVSTEYGKFKIKIAHTPDGKIKVKPESDEIMKSALKNKINPTSIYKSIMENYENDN